MTATDPTGAAAQTPDQGQEGKQEVASERTKYSKTYLNDDGTYTAEISPDQIHFGETGDMREIDTTLVACADTTCAYENRRGPMIARFGASGASDPLVWLDTNGTRVGFAVEGGNPASAPQVEGNTIVYPEVLPGVDLKFEVNARHVKNYLILRAAPPEPPVYRFPLFFENVTPSKTADGDVAFERPDGGDAFTIPSLFMTDSSRGDRSDEPAISEDVALGLEFDNRRPVAKVTPDADWLYDPARVYPVEIDPTLVDEPSPDTFVQSNILGTSQHTEVELKSGTYDGGSTKARSLLQFQIGSIPDAAIIESATLNLRNFYSWSCDPGGNMIQVHRIAEQWKYDVTWPNRPSFAPYTNRINEAHGYNSSCPDATVEFGVKEIVNYWRNNPGTNHGFGIRAENESNNFGWRKFRSKNAEFYHPKLKVIYNTPPDVPTERLPAGGSLVNTLTPKLSGLYNDPDPGDGGHLRFQVYKASDDPATAAPVVTTSDTDHGSFAEPGQRSSWQIPSGVLQDGVSYKWIARSYDGKHFSDWNATFRSFTVDVGPPEPPSNVTSTSHPKRIALQDDTVDMVWQKPLNSADLAGYSWSFDAAKGTVPDDLKEGGADVTSTTTALAEGKYYFNIKSLDQAGNASAVASYGPIVIDKDGAAVSLTPTLLDKLLVPESDEMGLEQFYAYRSSDLGTATSYTNLRTGNAVVQTDDLVNIPGEGVNTVVRLTYNSGRAAAKYHDTGVGKGWSLSVSDADSGLDALTNGVTSIDVNSPVVPTSFVNDGLEVAGFILEFTDGDGTVHRFVRKSSDRGGRWESPPGVGLRVRERLNATTGLPDAYELIRPDGVVYLVDNQTLAGIDLPTWQVVSVTDRNGNSLEFRYEALPTTAPLKGARLTDIVHNRTGKAVVHFDYDADKKLTRIVSLPGETAVDPGLKDDPSTTTDERMRSFERVTATTIDANGLLTEIAENSHSLDPNAKPIQEGSRTTRFSYLPATNALGITDKRLLEKVVDGRGNPSTLTYEKDPDELALAAAEPTRLKSLTDRRTNSWSYAYGPIEDTGERTTTLTTPLGSQTSYRLNRRGPVSTSDNSVAGGNIKKITDAGNNSGPVVTTFAWEQNLLVKTTDGKGNVTERFYNDLNLMTKMIAPPPNDPARTDAATQPVTTAFDYDAVGEFNYDATKCSQPADSTTTPHVSTNGWCTTVVELKQARAADNYDNQRRVTDFSHDDDGNLTRITERASHSGTRDPNDPDHLDVTADPNDRTTTLDYYQFGALRRVDGPRPSTDANDVTEFGDGSEPYGGYHRSGQPRTITDARKEVTEFDYTPYGRTGKADDRAEKITRALYDERDNLVEFVDPSGDTTRYEYDDNGNRSAVVSPRGTATATPGDYRSTYSYNASDQRRDTSTPGAEVGDPASVSKVTYDAEGNISSKTSPVAGSDTTYDYYPNEQLKEVSAAAGTNDTASTTYFYDLAGRRTRVLSPIVNGAGSRPETKLALTPQGQPATTSQTSDSGLVDRVTRSTYNALGETVATTGPRSVASVEERQEQNYNSFGEVVELRVRNVTSTSGTTEFLVHRYAYDHAGNRIRYEQPTRQDLFLVTEYDYDALNRLNSHNDPFNPGHTAHYSYLPEGQQEQRIDRVDGVDARTAVTSYNDDYTVASVVATDAHTANGPQTKMALCNFGAGQDPSSGYDADDNLLVRRTIIGGGCDVSEADRRQNFDYDQRGLLKSQFQQVRSPSGALIGRTQTFTYRDDGALKSTTWKGPGDEARTTTYGHSPGGLMESVTDWRANTSATTFDYFPSGAADTIQVAGDLVTGDLAYHADGSVKGLTWKKPGAVEPLRSHTAMGYDVGGLLRSETVNIKPVGGDTANDTGGDASFSYDLAGRLTGWTSPFRIEQLATTTSFTTEYTVDDGGNIDFERILVEDKVRRTIDPEYDPNGRLSGRTVIDKKILNAVDTTTAQSFSYSGLGEEIDRTSTTSALGFDDAVITTTTEYDSMGHTDSVKFAGDTEDPNVEYTYASDNQLIGRLRGTDRHRLYFYWGTSQALAEETDAFGTTKVRYLLSPSGQVMAQQRPDSWTWLLRDPDGNVATHLRDDGKVTAQRAYDPYGANNAGGTTKASDDLTTLNQDEGAGSESTLGYQGAHTDDVTNNLLLGPRAYDPEVDRFTSPDYFIAAPADLALGIDPLTGNRYLFAAANPVAFDDNGYAPACDTSGRVCRSFTTRKAVSQRSSGSSGGSTRSAPANFRMAEAAAEGASPAAFSYPCSSRGGTASAYLSGAMGVPCGFLERFNYLPAKRLTDIGIVMVNPEGECSKFRDTGLTYDFHDACATHDYGYDLLRADVLEDRKEVDLILLQHAEADCSGRGGIASAICSEVADVVYEGVRLFGWPVNFESQRLRGFNYGADN